MTRPCGRWRLANRHRSGSFPRSKGSAIQSWNATASRCSPRWPWRRRGTMHRQLNDKTLVSGQIAPEEVAALKALGVTLIVNNRPDGEDVGQPESGDIEA